MPVTQISSPAACDRAERAPGVAVAWLEGDIRRPSRTTFAARQSQADRRSEGER